MIGGGYSSNLVLENYLYSLHKMLTFGHVQSSWDKLGHLFMF